MGDYSLWTRLVAEFLGTAILMAVALILCATFLAKDSHEERPRIRLLDPLRALRHPVLLRTSIGAALYTAGVLTSNVVFAVLVHMFLTFPSGRLGSGTRRLLVLAAYADVIGLQAVAVLFDPLTRYHSEHPPNDVLVSSHAALASVLEELEAGLAIGIAAVALVTVYFRARAASSAARSVCVCSSTSKSTPVCSR